MISGPPDSNLILSKTTVKHICVFRPRAVQFIGFGKFSLSALGSVG